VDSLTRSPHSAEQATPAPVNRQGLWTFRLVTAVLWTVGILTMCWLPGELLQEVERGSSFFQIPYLDKLIHWGIFAGFAVLWLRLEESRRRYAWVVLAGIGLAALTEIVQALVPSIHRLGEIADFLIDALGVAGGIAFARWVEPWLGRLEARILPESWR
jgi:hypothetical protein